MDIIDVSPDDLVLPGDCLGGVIGVGGIGPFDECGGPWFPAAGRADPYGELWCEQHGSRCSDSAPLAIYDCRDEWLHDRLRRVLAAGERCAVCEGTGRCVVSDRVCAACGGRPHTPGGPAVGTGYTRQPHDLGPFIDAEIAGRITPRVAAGLVWASVLRVEAGLGPVCGVREPWSSLLPAGVVADGVEVSHRKRRVGAPGKIVAYTRTLAGNGWRVQGHATGFEVGDEGKDAADTAALNAGYALLNADHILLPLPDRIARLRLED